MTSAGTAGSQPEERPARQATLNYIPGFDGFRAIAVLMVLVSHVGYGNIVPGGFGVTVFFAISGYLISTLLLAELARTGSVDLRLFYVRRFLRLYPELIALVLLCLAVAPLLGLRATLTEKLAGLFYYMNYYYVFGTHHGELQSYPWRQLWSLAIEEHFYFFFPAVLLLLHGRRSAQLAFVGALIMLPFLWRFVTYYVLELPWQYNYVATDTRIDSVAWGCLLALLMRREDGTVRPLAALPFIRIWLVPAALALIAVTLLYRSEDFRWTWRFTLQGIGIVLLIANLLFDPRWRGVVAALEWTPVRYIGRISYGLYLYHMLLNHIVVKLHPGITAPALLAISLPASLLVASLSYCLLETPLKTVRRRFGSHVK